ERALDAAAAGALVVGQADDPDLPHYLTPGAECLACTPDDLASVVEHHLRREDLHLTVSRAGRRRALARGPDAAALAALRQRRDGLGARCRSRQARPVRIDLHARLWEAADAAEGDMTLVADLAEAVRHDPMNAGLHYALGLAEVLQAREAG